MDKTTKRQYRELDDMTKQKISQSLRGRCKSATHAQSISDGMKNYWKQVPNRPQNNEINSDENE